MVKLVFIPILQRCSLITIFLLNLIIDDSKIVRFVRRSHADEIFFVIRNEFIMFLKTATPSIYLDTTRKNPNRKKIVKLRMSNHILKVKYLNRQILQDFAM